MYKAIEYRELDVTCLFRRAQAKVARGDQHASFRSTMRDVCVALYASQRC